MGKGPLLSSVRNASARYSPCPAPPVRQTGRVTSPATHLSRGRVLALTALLILMWSLTFTTIKVTLRDISPMLMAGTRCIIGGAVVGLVALALRRSLVFRGNVAAYGALAATNVVGFVGLQTAAVRILPSGLAAILVYLQPILTVFLARALLAERLTTTTVAGAGVAFGGIVLIGAGGVRGHISAPGIALGVLSALAWSLGTISLKRYAGHIEPMWSVAIPFLAGGVALTAAAPALEQPWVHWTGSFLGAFAFTAVVGSGLAWLTWFTLLRHGDASTAAANIFLVPVLAVLFGVLLLGEQLTLTAALGAALVVLGVRLVNRPPRRAERPTP